MSFVDCAAKTDFTVILGSLSPALQSIWFVPHIVVYAIAYTLATGAVVLSVLAMLSKRKERLPHRFKTIDRLLLWSIVLLYSGMLIGAVWAKQIWGDFWLYDTKETWALITCVSMTITLLVRKQYVLRYKLATVCLLMSYIFLQMCWYGVNYLPKHWLNLHRYF